MYPLTINSLQHLIRHDDFAICEVLSEQGNKCSGAEISKKKKKRKEKKNLKHVSKLPLSFVSKYPFLLVSNRFSLLLPSKKMNTDGTAYNKDSPFSVTAVGLVAFLLLLSSSWLLLTTMRQCSSFPLASSCSKRFACPWKLSHLSLMLLYSPPHGSCSNVQCSGCRLGRFDITPSISTALPGVKRNIIFAVRLCFSSETPFPPRDSYPDHCSNPLFAIVLCQNLKYRRQTDTACSILFVNSKPP